ncbi:MAG: hypothetical protein NTV03_03475 [Candidatus Nomurabacteria bacterium]|nr:hypothetical protein [Candidatus Nomurabacteria bacterium]
MNKQKITRIFIIAVIIFLIGVASYFILIKKQSLITKNPIQTKPLPIEILNYTNAEYSFSIILPITWKGYSIVREKWNGQVLDGQELTDKSTKLEGPKILIRHPLWTVDNPRQDIPIMIFTPAQWDLVVAEKLSLGAAPIGPSELWRNANYVFALPARYNFAFQIGFEEVQQIIDSKSFKAF